MTEPITPADLSARLADASQGPFVLDVRPGAEYEAWHVPGSENIDLHQELHAVPAAAKAVLATIPDDREVVVACNAGIAAERAAEYLRELGYDVATLACHRP